MLKKVIIRGNGHPQTVHEAMSTRRINNFGYVVCFLRRPGHPKQGVLLHRIVALTFIPNPNNYPIVHHKNSNRLDYSIDNLEWTTHYKNIGYAKAQGKYKRKHLRDKYVKSPDTILILNTQSGVFHYSVTEAAACYGYTYMLLMLQLKGKSRNRTNLIILGREPNMYRQMEHLLLNPNNQ